MDWQSASSVHERTVCTILGAVVYLMTPTLYFLVEYYASSYYRPSYSYVENVTSDLGTPYAHSEPSTGRLVYSARAGAMNLNFIANGILFVIGQQALLGRVPNPARRTVRIVNAWLYFIGITMVATLPSGPKADANGTRIGHGIGAILAIGCGNMNSLLVAFSPNEGQRSYRIASGMLGGAGLTPTILAMITGQGKSIKGLIQRSAIYPTFLWQYLTAVLLISELELRRSPKDRKKRD